MTFLPIVDRELRVAARRRGTYLSRVIVALLVIGIGIWIYLMGKRRPPSEVSIAMFIGLTIVAGLFSLFCGLQSTTDCLSEEKRDGTLGLLFLTDLRVYDVVGGKLVANSLNAFYGLIAALPMLAIPMMMGGVTLGEFWRIALVLVNTMFFSLTAGMLASSLSKTARGAASLWLGIVFGITVMLPLSAVILAAVYELNGPHKIMGLLLPSPGCAFVLGYEQNFRGEQANFWTSTILVHVMAWSFLLLACLIIPRSWQDKAVSTAKLRWRDRWMQWSLGNTSERACFRGRLLDVNAFYWLVARSRIKPATVWALLGVLACAWVWGWSKVGRDWLNPGIYIFTAILLNTIIKCWFASETSAQLAEDRRIGALELLLSTPLDVRQILRGQFLGLCRQFLWPVLFVVAIELVFMIAGLEDAGGGWGEWILVWISGLIILLADLGALFYVGQWLALTARTSSRANTAALARILALPWILYGVFLMFIALSTFASRPGPDLDGGFFIFMWLLIGLGVDVLFGLRARMRLGEEFRAAVTKHYTRHDSIWKRWFGSHTANTSI